MGRELNMDGFQGIANAFKGLDSVGPKLEKLAEGMRDYPIATKARTLADISARFGISLEEAEGIVRLLEVMDISAEKYCALEKIEERKNKRMLEKNNYLQAFDQRKKSQVIKRKIRYQKKLP